jgi:hypothetical protein
LLSHEAFYTCVTGRGVYVVLAEVEVENLEAADWKRALRVAAAQEGESGSEDGGVLLDCEACGTKAMVPGNLAGLDGWIACPNSDCQRR